MQKYGENITTRSSVGQLSAVSGASVRVRTFPGLANVQLYSANSLTALIGTPGTLLTTDANGHFEFYAADGRYRIDWSGSGISPGFLEDVLLDDPVDTQAVLSGDYLEIADGLAAPAAAAGRARIYIDVADGDLKIKFADGVIKTISVDT